MFVVSITILCYLLSFININCEVIDLTSKTFEHLTQASTGSTTGDWLVKFYAPWCGHCKTLAPIYEEVAEKLAGEVNVARVDVPANRDLGTRFEIKGFPTLKFISKGKVYTFKGKRTVDEILEFVRGGYQVHQPEDVQPAFGFLGEIAHVYRQAYKKAGKDLSNWNVFTIDVFLAFLPLIFVLLVVFMILIPEPPPPATSPRAREKQAKRKISKETSRLGMATDNPSIDVPITIDEDQSHNKSE